MAEQSGETMVGMFDVPAEAVVAGAACAWCAAGVGVECSDGNRLGERRPAVAPHAQRWRDFWNVTHGRQDRHAVYPAPWLRCSPTSNGDES